MNAMKRKNRRLLLIAVSGCLLMLGACSPNTSDQAGGGTEDQRQQALYDRDSRNNEDPSLGVKQRWVDEQSGPRKQPEYIGPNRTDMTNPHFSTTARFDPRIAEAVKSVPGVQAAQVLVTNNNAYVAVVLDGHNPDTEASPEMMTLGKNGGAGLFASYQGPNRFSWTEAGGLADSKTVEIRNQVASADSNIQQVYVSANPNFVQRVRFYAKEEQEKGSFTSYMNEINTLIQVAFPSDINTRK